MKNFILGFVTALFLVGIGYAIYRLLPASQEPEEPSYTVGECGIINPEVKDFGKLKVTVLHQGSPATDLEVDLSTKAGADEYCTKDTDESGIVVFDGVPVGTYEVYFNMGNFPDKYGIPAAILPVEIQKDETTDAVVELTDESLWK